MSVIMATFDAGYLQEETIAHCRNPARRAICRPTKGENASGRELSPIIPSGNLTDDDSSRLVMVGVRRAKNFVDAMIRNETPGQKYCHFPSSMAKVIKRFFTQKGRGLFAEEHTVDDAGVEKWERRLKFSTGEVWDTLAGNLVAIELAARKYRRQVGLVIADVEAAALAADRPLNELTQDNSVMAGVYEAIQYGLVSGAIEREAWERDIVTVMPSGGVQARKVVNDTEEKHPALAGIRINTGAGRMRIRMRSAA